MGLRYSGENYLKSIFLLHQEQSVVRSVDIAERLGFTKASVSRMLKNLVLADFLEIPLDIAARDAGGMEHIISEETLCALQKLLVKKGTGDSSDYISDTASD